MQSFTHIIRDPYGIHARPAGLLASAVKPFSASVTVACRDKVADGRRLLALMELGARCGDELRFTVSGSDEDEAVRVLRRRCEEVI